MPNLTETLIEKITLKNGLNINLFDASKKIAGDRWQVTLIARMNLYIDHIDAITEKNNLPVSVPEIKKILGPSVVFELKKQRQFIDDKEKELILIKMIDSFKKNTAPYISHPEFAKKYILKELKKSGKYSFL